MTDAKKILVLFSTLFGIVFFAMLLSFIPGDDISFTNLPEIGGSDIPTLNKNNPTYGSDEPKVLIYHFGDFSNQASAGIAQSLMKIADENDAVTIAWKDFPNISLDPESMNAAVAARCAQKQDSFWEFHDYLYLYSDALNEELYSDIASELGLWQWSFDRCLSKEKTMDWVLDDMQEAQDISITAAPTIFINGEQYIGLLSESDLRSIINSALLTQ
ncbi:DsbA family protein [Candidatus Uhrbacteria bacterium]|jgi:protein-disulfide isomerase|nr:DsbA family protein [Candidatus Uhrbacteria bacterium]MBT7717505.1 DsbA family protein [Candidatus Uhrbacteria bacterium]